MKAVIIDTKEAQNKWWAYNDAHMRSVAKSSLYSDSQKARAERMRYALELVYNGKNFYIQYGKKAISIKIDHAIIKDRKTLRLLEADYEVEGIVKKLSAQGVVYNIPRA